MVQRTPGWLHEAAKTRQEEKETVIIAASAARLKGGRFLLIYEGTDYLPLTNHELVPARWYTAVLLIFCTTNIVYIDDAPKITLK